MNSQFELVDYARFRPYVVANALVERLHTGLRWAEGPVWFADMQALLWSDVPGNRMHRWVEGQGASVFREPSGHANGNTRDLQGRLLTCESGTRRVTRTELNGEITVLAERFEGKRLNSPNDIVVRSDGSVWFTDPDYGILSDYTGEKAASEIGHNCVFRIDPATGALRIATDALEKPNGIAFSPDERVLYVADSGGTHRQGGPADIVAFDVAEDGALRNRRLFATVQPGVPDGFRLDEDGNIWTSAADGVHCIAPDGATIGKIHLDETVTNVCFGGRRRSRLFITAGTSLYAVYVGTRGLAGR
jgi:gluconolactonase